MSLPDTVGVNSLRQTQPYQNISTPTASTATNTAAPNAGTPTTAPNYNLTPAYSTNFLQGGQVPQYGASTAYTTAVNAPTIGNAPTISPNAVNAPQAGYTNQVSAPTVQTQGVSTALSSLNLSNPALAQQLYAGLSPQFAAQNRGLTESLANAGIVGGSTGGAQGALDLQQQQQFTSALAPLQLQQEQMALNQSQGNQSATNQVGLANASNALTASGQNASNSLSAQNANASNNQAVNLANQQIGYNASAANAANDLSAQNTNASNWLNSNEFNAGNALTASQNNATNMLNAGEYNASAQNAASQYNDSNILNTANNQAEQAWNAQALQAQLANSNWAMQYQDQANLNASQAGAGTAAYAPNYYTPPAVNLGSFSSLIPSSPAQAASTGSTGSVNTTPYQVA